MRGFLGCGAADILFSNSIYFSNSITGALSFSPIHSKIKNNSKKKKVKTESKIILEKIFK